MPAALDLSWLRFGRLVVTNRFEYRHKSKRRFWLCRCDCGTEKFVSMTLLRRGATRSCGCLVIERLTKHGGKGSKLYDVWVSMRQRCMNKNSTHYQRYGGRGIFVCDRWKNSFQNFTEDMGPRPSDKHSVDRIDNDGPYSPDNCRWATRAEQNANKSTSTRISFRGQTKTLTEISKQTGISRETIRCRLLRGFTADEAVLVPKRLKVKSLFKGGHDVSF